MKRVAVLLLVSASACRVEAPAVMPETDPSVEPAVSEARTDAHSVRQNSPYVGTEPDRVSPTGLVVPVLGVLSRELVDTFDDARSEGRVHDAIDIMAPRGTPVVAAASGTVARLFESERGGRTVYVQDGLTVYYYAHLDGYVPGLTAGQVVERGQPIGRVGSTGNASAEAPHLHFAIWKAPSAEAFWDGDPLNPYPLLTAPR